MNAFVAVIRRELLEKRIVFAGAFLLGVVVTVGPLLKSVQNRELVTTAAFYLAVALALGSAFASGASVICRDLSERRMSFYFARPLSAHAIFGGKLLAAFLMSISVGTLVMIPPTLIGEGFVRFLRDGWIDGGPGEIASIALLLLLPSIVVSILLAHGISAVLRSRSKWVAVDMISVLTFAGVIWLLVQPALQLFATFFFAAVVVAGAGCFMVSGLVASWIGFVRGRTDFVRIQRSESIALACGLAISLALAGAYVGWVTSVDADDLDEIYPSTAGYTPIGSERWVDFIGASAGRTDYSPRFIYDSETGTLATVDIPPFAPVVYSADGRWAVWGVATSLFPWKSSRLQLVRAELGETIRSEPLDEWFPAHSTSLALSADGSRLAVLSWDGLLSITDLVTGGSIVSLKMPDEGPSYVSLWFSTDDQLRVYSEARISKRAGDREYQIYEADLVTKSVSHLGSFEGSDTGIRIETTNDVILTFRPRQVLDGRTGDLRFALPEGITGLRYLDDGRVLYGETHDGRARVVIVEAGGVESRSIDLGPAVRVATGYLLPDQQVVAVTSPSHSSWEESSLFVIDLRTAEARKAGEGLVPAVDGFWASTSRTSGPGLYLSGSSDHHTLVAFNPLTGERRHVAGRR